MINIYNIFVRMNIAGFFLVLLSLFNVPFLSAQPLNPYSSSAIYQKIRKLGVLGSVLYVAAHPDDENTRLLGWLAGERMVRTGYLSITRGDGGQNLIGDEQGVELGLIRTQELLAAREIDGAEQFFTSAFDFGYSKSTGEALKIWKKEKVLADVVWVIRRFRPDVIVTRFPPDTRAGHGHHSASAVLANEAFALAADPNAFPEQLRHGVQPWQATRIFWNNYNFGNITTIREDQLNIDLGGYNPVLGKSYGEIAAESRSQHKSQGFGVASSRGSQPEYFSLTAGTPVEKDILEGIGLDWSRVGGAKIGAMVENIISAYRISDPAASVPALLKLRRAIKGMPAGYWKDIKLKEVDEIIRLAGGVWIDAYAGEPSVARGSEAIVNFTVNNREGLDLRLRQVRIAGWDTALAIKTEPNRNYGFRTLLRVPAAMPVSQPYWLREKMNGGSYNIGEQELVGRPDPLPAFVAEFVFDFGRESMTYMVPVRYRHTDPVKGELYQPFVVLPAPGEAGKFGTLRHISYPHIPDIYYFNTDTVNIALGNVKIVGKNIGYIEGAGDKVPQALRAMGYQVTLLSEKDLAMPELSRFDAIITGVRAYNVHAYLSEKNRVLNEYVSHGGNLVVQYNTNSYAGPSTARIGPYPFEISRNRITDEQSPVEFVLPDHPVLNFPNRITQKDFDNWIQERGIYFAGNLPPVFETPLALSDPGEEMMKGSLAVADYGKGKFVYTGLVFFRQLPAGVEGAYRLLANIIALNQNSAQP